MKRLKYCGFFVMRLSGHSILSHLHKAGQCMRRLFVIAEVLLPLCDEAACPLDFIRSARSKTYKRRLSVVAEVLLPLYTCVMRLPGHSLSSGTRARHWQQKNHTASQVHITTQKHQSCSLCLRLPSRGRQQPVLTRKGFDQKQATVGP